MEKELITAYGRLFFKEEICFVYFNQDTEATEDIIENIHASALQFFNGKAHAMLVDLSLNVSSTIEGRKYGSENQYVDKHIAYALVGKSLPVNLLANFFIKINRPKIETRLFVNEKEALVWLKDKIRIFHHLNQSIESKN